MSSANVKFVHVPYARGLAPALNDLLGGHVHLMFANLSDAKPHVQGGRLKALAVTSAQPVDGLPGVPPASRFVPGLLSETWYALAAPAQTPAPIVEKIASDVASVLKGPDVRERLAALSLTPVASAPQHATAFVEAEAERWRVVIDKVGLKPE
jgi:tripartite-type tricarboxylate transporter receptor subunit TctC